jgi:hypothetical protein
MPGRKPGTNVSIKANCIKENFEQIQSKCEKPGLNCLILSEKDGLMRNGSKEGALPGEFNCMQTDD